jgi:hypothetical protein
MEMLEGWVDGLEAAEAGKSPTVSEEDRKKQEVASLATQRKMEALAPADQAAAIDKMSKEDFASWVKNLPAAEKDRLGPLLDQTASPEKKLVMWGESYKGEAHDMAAAAHAELNTPGISDQRANELKRTIEAANKDMSEADQEVAAMAGEWKRNGGTVGVNDLEDLRFRKGREMDIEKARGVNVTNETETIVQARAGGKARWSEAELEKLDKEMGHLPPHMRPFIPEYHRATTTRAGLGGMWDGKRLNCYSDNPGVWRHEMAHAIDTADDQGKPAGTSASERYKANMKFQDLPTEDALKAALRGKIPEAEIDAKIQELKSNPGEGAFGQQSIEIDGTIYSTNDGTHFSSYDARRVPRRGKAEKDDGTWQDVYDFGRSKQGDENPMHFYEEHVNNALADPMRIHSDFVRRPEADVQRLKEEIAAKSARGEDTTDAQAELTEAETTRDSMREQYDLVRETLGVDKKSIEAAAAGLSDAQREAFMAQADKVSSSEQLKKLRQTWADGTAIGTQHVANRMHQLRQQGMSEDAARAYYEDAKHCVTREQLDHLTQKYREGKRSFGEWDPSKMTQKGEQIAGY